MPAQPQPGDIVWIACRAKNACEGQQAEIVFVRRQGQGAKKGEFIPTVGGKIIRYKCLTCGQPFHIST